MAVRISSTSFVRYLAAQSTTRVTKVREAKRMMLASSDDYRRLDYWLVMREAAMGLLTGSKNRAWFDRALAEVNDPKKIENYQAAGEGLRKWMGRKNISASPLASKIWRASGLEVAVTPELAISWPGSTTHVMKLFFGADSLSKYTANPLLRLIEHTHGHIGTAAVLDVRKSKLHVGPTARPADLDILLNTEAASYVAIWNSI